MTAADETELHTFAEKIGVNRSSFLGKENLCYTLTYNQRRAALESGARKILDD